MKNNTLFLLFVIAACSSYAYGYLGGATELPAALFLESNNYLRSAYNPNLTSEMREFNAKFSFELCDILIHKYRFNNVFDPHRYYEECLTTMKNTAKAQNITFIAGYDNLTWLYLP